MVQVFGFEPFLFLDEIGRKDLALGPEEGKRHSFPLNPNIAPVLEDFSSPSRKVFPIHHFALDSIDQLDHQPDLNL